MTTALEHRLVRNPKMECHEGSDLPRANRDCWAVLCLRVDRAQPLPDAVALLDGLARRPRKPENLDHVIYVLAETNAGFAV